TFRDMGLAFGIALLIIYMLVVWEFKNFIIPLIVMAPIPLTLIGIAPGHWLLDAEFTATSMIGFIALAGIIVRNSILLVDFSRQEIKQGVAITEAVIQACKARTRPIIITAVALVLGSSVILFDPIFQGMAISLMFGVLVATLLTLVVIPLGCVSARAAFCPGGTDSSGDRIPSCNMPEENATESSAIQKTVHSIKTVINPYFSIHRRIKLDKDYRPITTDEVIQDDVMVVKAAESDTPPKLTATAESNNETQAQKVPINTTAKNAKEELEQSAITEPQEEQSAVSEPAKTADKPKRTRKTPVRKTNTATTTPAKKTRSNSTSKKSNTPNSTASKPAVTRRKRGIQLKEENNE
ncbi:MAG: efflux RND transporter permease subunit, partial [Thiomicrorhabdus sp.]|nr:efflux RND transporter permease subunit [Thiomicrorhabdus sp.]